VISFFLCFIEESINAKAKNKLSNIRRRDSISRLYSSSLLCHPNPGPVFSMQYVGLSGSFLSNCYDHWFLFVIFLLAIVSSVLLRFRGDNYPLLFLHLFLGCKIWLFTILKNRWSQGDPISRYTPPLVCVIPIQDL
jgi:hypothetical protein